MTKPNDIEIQQWICSYIADTTQIPASEIDPDAPFTRLGLDSASAVDLTGELEVWLGIEVDPRLPYDYPTTRKLSARIAADLVSK